MNKTLKQGILAGLLGLTLMSPAWATEGRSPLDVQPTVKNVWAAGKCKVTRIQPKDGSEMDTTVSTEPCSKRGINVVISGKKMTLEPQYPCMGTPDGHLEVCYLKNK